MTLADDKDYNGGGTMKKLILFGLCALFATGCSIESVEPEVIPEEDEQASVETVVERFEPRNVTASYIIIDSRVLNVRTDADIDADKVGQVADNESYQVLDEKLDSQKRIWYKIQTKEGAKGYVAGWFCAKTNITILVEADQATILGIETEPTPRYIENPFDENSARVGDQIVGLVIKEISAVSDLNKILFDGEVELTGDFYHENSDLSFGRVVRFVPDEASSVLLPRITQEITSTTFILDDYDKVANQFGEIGTTGRATIMIKDYTIGHGTSDAFNEAKLINVKFD